jgi:hypothetical protein
MQKLLAVYLSNLTAERALHEHGDVREFLAEYLAAGWKVSSITPLGSVVAAPGAPTSTWAMVLIEKPNAPRPQPPATPQKPT